MPSGKLSRPAQFRVPPDARHPYLTLVSLHGHRLSRMTFTGTQAVGVRLAGRLDLRGGGGACLVTVPRMPAG